MYVFLFTVRDSFPYKRYKSPKHQPWGVIYKNIKWYKTIEQGCKNGTKKKYIQCYCMHYSNSKQYNRYRPQLYTKVYSNFNVSMYLYKDVMPHVSDSKQYVLVLSNYSVDGQHHNK